MTIDSGEHCRASFSSFINFLIEYTVTRTDGVQVDDIFWFIDICKKSFYRFEDSQET